MPAPKGHPLWGNPMKPKKYTPEQLWNKACEYFEWCDNNPIMVVEQAKMPQRLTDKMALGMKPAMVKKFLQQTVSLPHPRAYSIEAFCIFADMDSQTYYNYASGEETYITYFEICARIKKIIDSQHFEGGMVGTFNANIVTRKLGLVEKQQQELNQTMKIEVKDNETKEEVEKLLKK